MHTPRGFETSKRTFDDRQVCLESGTEKIRFEYCLDMPCPVNKMSSRSFRKATHRSKTAKERADSSSDGLIIFHLVGSTSVYRSVFE